MAPEKKNTVKKKSSHKKGPKRLWLYTAFFGLFFCILILFGRFILYPLLISPEKGVISGSLVQDSSIDNDSYHAAEGAFGKISFYSFFEPFFNLSNVERMNNLYYDEEMTALMFSPDYEWRPDSSLSSSSISSNFSESYDKRCLKSSCLELKGSELFFNERKLRLPEPLSSGRLSAVSIGALDDRFMVGLTYEKDKKYQGFVYSYNGNNFSRLLKSEDISSEYSGLFGFGGKSDDFLVIYGAKKGIAYRLSGKNVYDISRFFDYRVMANGFKPEVLRVDRKGNVAWYIYSLSKNNPTLVKLWSNSGESKGVSGAVSFRKSLPGADGVLFSVESLSDEEIRLAYKTSFASGTFVDRGFKNDLPGEYVSAQIPYQDRVFKFRVKEIEKANFELDSASLAKLNNNLIQISYKEIDSVKSEGDFWSSLLINDLKQFSGKKIEKLRLKAVFPVETDKFSSPFFSELSFDFRYSRD